MVKLTLVVLVVFLAVASAHPGHKNKDKEQGGHKKKHGSHGHHHRQPAEQQEEDNRMAVEEAQKVLDSLDDLSTAVKRVSLATENGINYRGNEIGKKS